MLEHAAIIVENEDNSFNAVWLDNYGQLKFAGQKLNLAYNSVIRARKLINYGNIVKVGESLEPSYATRKYDLLLKNGFDELDDELKIDLINEDQFHTSIFSRDCLSTDSSYFYKKEE